MTVRFRDLTIVQKLWVLIAAGLVGLVLSAAYSLYQLHGSLLAERKTQARSVVEAAQAVLEHFEAEAAAGRLSEAEARRTAIGVLSLVRYGAGNYLWINDMTSRAIMNPAQPDLVGQDQTEVVDPTGRRIVVSFLEVARTQGSGFVEYLWPKPSEERPSHKVAFVKAFPKWGWVLGSGVYLDDFEEAMRKETGRTLIAMLALGALLCLPAWALGRSVSGDLRRAVGVAHQLAQGDMTVRIQEVAADEAGQLLGALKEMIERHSRVLAEVRSAAGSLSSSSDRVTAIARSVLQGSRDQAASAAESAVSMQRMFASIEANRDVARGTDRLAARAVREASEGREAVLEAAAAVQQISEKILVIHEIAHQTTLLAHDFSIEETRTGVGHATGEASEHVRTLYEQTRTAAQEIGMLAGSSAALVNKACRYLEAIVPSIEKAARQAQAVSTAADEATSHARQIAAAESRQQGISQEHATAAAKLSVEAADVRRRAQELQELVAYFTLGDAERQAPPPAAVAVATPPPGQATLPS